MMLPSGRRAPGQPSQSLVHHKVPGWSDFTVQKLECTTIKNSYLTVPTNRTGSCGITVSLVLSSCKPIVQISASSMQIVPLAGSTRWNKAIPSDDFPGNDKSKDLESSISLHFHHIQVSNQESFLCNEDGSVQIRARTAMAHFVGTTSCPGAANLPTPVGVVSTRLILLFHQNDSHLINPKIDVCLLPTPHTHPFNLKS